MKAKVIRGSLVNFSKVCWRCCRYSNKVPYYSTNPPKIRFITNICHCNNNDDEKTCHDTNILKTASSQKTSMYNVVMEILRLLREPNTDDVLSSVKDAQFKASRGNYDNIIVEWKMSYASVSGEQLKTQYLLE